MQYLSEHKSADPQRGIAFLPKRGVNTHENEVMRAYRTVNDSFIEPVSFIVPRRAEVFQNDIYPPTTGLKAAMGADDFFSGKTTSLPPKISLESLYDGQEPEEIPADQAPKPAAIKATPAPAANLPAKAEPQSSNASSAPTPTTSRGPPPSMSDNKASMASLADKFADKDGEDDSDDSSSFEEVPKPVGRHAAAIAVRQEEKTGSRSPPVQSSSSPTKTTSAPVPAASSTFSGEALEPAAKATNVSVPELEKASTPAPTNGDSAATSSTSAPSAASAAKGAADGIRGVLQDIKGMLAQQGQVMAMQGEKIEILAREVASLKSRLGE